MTYAVVLQLQESHDQLASRSSLMEVQLVELQVQRLEALQVSQLPDELTLSG